MLLCSCSYISLVTPNTVYENIITREKMTDGSGPFYVSEGAGAETVHAGRAEAVVG